MNDQLRTFVQVAESRSFSKAAEALFISSTAVMKQINQLEKQVGIPLFIRTNHGVRLTEAGVAFSKDAVFMLQYYQEALIRMHQAAQADRHMIRVGTSILNPCKVLLDRWNGVSSHYPQFNINIIHIEDNAHTLSSTYRTIGKDIDLIVAPFLTDHWGGYFRKHELGRYRFCFSVSRNHRLASKQTLSLQDLHGERVAVVNGGKNEVVQEVRDYLARNHPQIRIKDIPRLYDFDVFNRCVESDTVLLTLEAWTDIHPSLVTLPSDLEYTVPYGLLYPLHPSEEVHQFLEIIKAMPSE